MKPTTIQALAAMPARQLLTRVNLLEVQLALPETTPPCRVEMLRERQTFLEKALADRAAALAAPASVPAIPELPEVKKEVHGRALFVQSVKVEGKSERPVPAGATGRERMKSAMSIQGVK
jgi:hypothetical protein